MRQPSPRLAPWVVLPALLGGCPEKNPPPRPPPLGNWHASQADVAWNAWRAGQIRKAADLAAECVNMPEIKQSCRHLALLTAHVRGRHELVLRLRGTLKLPTRRRPDPTWVAVHSLLHLARYRQALDLARKGKLKPWLITRLAQMAARPLGITLTRMTKIPFRQGGPLDPFMPGFDARINGQQSVLRLDTGGTYLIMAPAEARRLKIATVCGGRGQHAFFKTRLCTGTADSLILGDARLRNVPVTTVSTLGPGMVIFGTNLLEPFLATIDYPGRRLILSRRGHESQRLAHRDIVASGALKVPFYVWGDHYMFAHGRLGDHERLVLFVDSGLVAITTQQGRPEQAGFTASRESFRLLGIPLKKTTKPQFIPFRGQVGLGPVIRDGILVYHNPQTWKKMRFGGIRIDGLISHAFLSHYQWTIDFDHQQYLFGRR